ncbi:MAG TPA: DinB family protein [Rhodothermales bacterium]
MSELDLLITNLTHAFSLRSWHGPNLLGAIRGLTPDEAAWRPQPGRHNAWEYIVHAAYWKYRIVRLLDPTSEEPFTFAGSNFFVRPVTPTKAALKSDVVVLVDWHRRVMETVLAVDPTSLDDKPGKREFSTRELILGAAAHDLYHAGQIRLLRRMYGDRTA